MLIRKVGHPSGCHYSDVEKFSQAGADGRVGHPGRSRHQVVSGDGSVLHQLPKTQVIRAWCSHARDPEDSFRATAFDVTR